MILVLLLIFPLFSNAEVSVSVERGRVIYAESCAACHGNEGDGRGPASVAIKGNKPRDFTSGVFKYGSSDEAIYKTISDGVPNTVMPSWSYLSKEDRFSVIKYIRTFKK